MNNKTESSQRRLPLRILLSIGLLICLVIFSTGILLKVGIELNTVSFGRVMISDFSLIWQDKLELQVGAVAITGQRLGDTSSEEFSFSSKSISVTRLLAKLFSKVSIGAIRVGEFTGALDLQQDGDSESSFFSLTSDDITFRSKLTLEQNTLVVDIEEAVSKHFNSEATGQIQLDIDKEILTGTLLANISGSLPVILEFSADSEKLSFKGKEAGKIITIKPLVDLFGLRPDIQRWITEYLKGSRYNLKTFNGHYAWQNPEKVLDTLYAEVRVDDCKYTFAPGLEPIKTRYTDVVFKKGVLTITPHESTFYGQKAEGSWVDIDFNDLANIILTTHIKTSAMANADILALLNYYKIPLPFKQTQGSTTTDLILTINLNKLKVDARGTFLIDEGIVEYNEKKIGVKNAKITLENSNVTIEHVFVRFEEQFAANISGIFHAASGEGELDISLAQCAFKLGESTLMLNKSEVGPTAKYRIRPDGYSIDASASSWNMDDVQLNLGSFSSSYSFDELFWVFLPVQLTTSSGISTKLSGSFSHKKKQAKIQCNLEKYNTKDVVLEDPSVSIAIEYDQGWIIREKEVSRWRLNNISTTFYPAEIKYNDHVLTVANRRISYGDFFDSMVSGHYNILLKKGEFLLGNLQIKEKNIGELLGENDSISIEVSGEEDSVVFKVPELDLEISTDENKNWSASISDLSAVHKRSKVLQQFMLDEGSVTVSLDSTRNTYDFSADIPYRYPLLVKDSTPVDHYIISGSISAEKGLSATVNEDLQIHYVDQLSVTSKDLGYNIPAIINLVNGLPQYESGPDESRNFSYSLKASNSSLFFKKGCQAIADKIYLKSVDEKVEIFLENGEGHIVLGVEGDEFSIEGKDLEDTFINNLIEGAEFHNGHLDIAAKGTFDNFSAIFKIEDTVLREHKTLNNIMAFLNTIPALITFSLPEYNSKGLPISSAVAGVRVTEGLFSFESFEVQSPVLSIAGTGWIDINKNLINMDFNLITDAKKNLSKIPLLGFVIAGDKKKPSITVEVTGDLQDPKVKKSVFHGIATKPVSILYRTLNLPLRFVDSMSDSPDEKQSTEDIPDSNESTQ